MVMVKAPFNYIGNKYRIINDLEQYFPQDINNFVDLFCGGGDVTINTEANHKTANDINFFVIGILNWIKSHSIEDTLTHINERIKEYHLSKTNKEGFLVFRKQYNSTPIPERHPVDLYVLMCYGFNYQFRFNSKLEFNNPFGQERSCFSDTMKTNLISLHQRIQNTDFTSLDFREVDLSSLEKGDFLYADPPYILSCGSYNDGKRGFKGWSLGDDMDLMHILDKLNMRGIRFAMSNVMEHKGNKNTKLQQWTDRNGYFVHSIKFNYNNSNYHSRNKENKTQEVLITNY